MVFGLDVSPPPPMQIGDPSSDGFQGYEVDLMHHIADALDAALVYRVAVWSACSTSSREARSTPSAQPPP